MAEWLACRILDLQVAGSIPDGATFRFVITLSILEVFYSHFCRPTKPFIRSVSIN